MWSDCWNEIRRKNKYAVAVCARDHQIVNAFDPIEFKCDFCYCSHWLFSASCMRCVCVYVCRAACVWVPRTLCFFPMRCGAFKRSEAWPSTNTDTHQHTNIVASLCSSSRWYSHSSYRTPQRTWFKFRLTLLSHSLPPSLALDRRFLRLTHRHPAKRAATAEQRAKLSVDAPSFTQTVAASAIACASFNSAAFLATLHVHVNYSIAKCWWLLDISIENLLQN